MKDTFNVEKRENGRRIDRVVHGRYLQWSRSQVQRFVENGDIVVNGKPVKSSQKLMAGDEVVLQITEQPKTELLADSSVQFDVIHEAHDYVVVNKPAGLKVHPDNAGSEPTLVHGLFARYPEIAEVGDDAQRPGIVHRLDRDVSGVMVVARTQEMLEHLKNQWQARSVEKEYIALVREHMPEKAGRIKSFIRRSTNGKLKMASDSTPNNGGKEAVTEYKVEQTWPAYQLVRVRTLTGRTHQIRVHLAGSKNSIVGDRLYATDKSSAKKLNRIFLHAEKLAFVDLQGEKQEFTAELPRKLEGYLKALKGAIS